MLSSLARFHGTQAHASTHGRTDAAEMPWAHAKLDIQNGDRRSRKGGDTKAHATATTHATWKSASHIRTRSVRTPRA
eukprot:5877857-Pleurochrysis_carterae.AAC.1